MNAQGKPASRHGAVSLKDIADELGISQTAVSFAINDKPGVSEETKRNVREAAARLGWTPTYAARALGSNKTMTIGFAPSRSSEGYQTETFMLHFMAGIHESLSRQGYGLLFRPCKSTREEMSVYRDWARSKRVDGVILVDLRADDPRPKLLRDLGLPAVLAGGPDPDDIVPSLSIDDSRTMETILTHLTLLGHRRIAYLSGDSHLDYCMERTKAFERFTSSRGLGPLWIEFTDFDMDKALIATQRLLAEDEPPTAFIFESETLAAASIRVITEVKVRQSYTAERGSGGVYPYNMPATVSFEDSFICESAYPSITAVHRDAGEYGVKIANLLLKLLAGEPVSGNRKILSPQLVVRESTRLPMIQT
ncbi:LacI family DNA-binding transcriptional regulator [Bifidobacterium eulemuris]|uniref:LacI family DNA-binding transcriptional regulator n=1 Tax=Bifidobacterium eulemuris TaxID=1765219 RepID=A0A261G9G0_9BIFI|nr:LacI family DNA-binding transcriptional regulator [Bifidobacterium eulemuris]OZG68067.1 LacI family transcriptional regulator [Bifidobacterium eulemuris]QOL31859.1 LacI family DNA-binding transcriptional regulator [Bifidobacterium eulemuris]